MIHIAWRSGPSSGGPRSTNENKQKAVFVPAPKQADLTRKLQKTVPRAVQEGSPKSKLDRGQTKKADDKTKIKDVSGPRERGSAARRKDASQQRLEAGR